YIILSISILENNNMSKIFSILLLTILILTTLRLNINKVQNKIDKKIFTFINIILIFIVLLWSYVINSIDTIVEVVASSYISNLEPTNYNSNFNIVNYNNIKILYQDNISAIIPLLNELIDSSKYKCEKIFSNVNASFTIKLDYNEDVFLSRFGEELDNISSYYIDSTKTIYIYLNNYSDILNDKNNFSNMLTHEISHYYFSEFLKENDILAKNVPVWINEGVADYISKRLYNLDYSCSEFIEFNKLSDSSDWLKIKSGKQYIQSYHSINTLVNMINESVITNLLLELKEHNINEAFKKATNLDFNKFENIIKKFNISSEKIAN
uniref:DUF5700 domain-containing putative Zn-dependent protease n=1 Tax=Clostridium sp. D53t1_180928_C8 TaxID=2787101 RepID=UPI0018AA1946